MTEPIMPAKAAITDHSLKVNGPTWLAVCEGAVPVAMPWIASLIARIEADAATIKGLRERTKDSGCADGHQTIRFDGETCPLCVLLMAPADYVEADSHA